MNEFFYHVTLGFITQAKFTKVHINQRKEEIKRKNVEKYVCDKPWERGNILQRVDNVDPLISEPPDEEVSYEARHYLEDQGVLDADCQALHRHGGLTAFLLALVLVDRLGLQNVLKHQNQIESSQSGRLEII